MSVSVASIVAIIHALHFFLLSSFALQMSVSVASIVAIIHALHFFLLSSL